jgi:hypothetical protein
MIDYSLLTMLLVLIFGVILLAAMIYQDWRSGSKLKHKQV